MSDPFMPDPAKLLSILVRRFWVVGLIAVMILGTFVVWVSTAFNDLGYAPEQPIAFYHKVHAGDLKIDCTFCHFNAERGKHAGVPPMSVCMGCHANVVTDKPEYQKEIDKLKAIADKGSYTGSDGVVYDGGVVHWKRVHRLPDHVYFAHQWHVKAGVACQTCHGPIQDMTVVRQYADLSMGWCLDCHRKSNYVGGRHYDPSDPTTFTEGTISQEGQLERQEPDPVVTFIAQTPAKQQAEVAKANAGMPVPVAANIADPQTPHQPLNGEADRPTYINAVLDDSQTNIPPDQREAIKAKLQTLPIWRLSDLPESHRKYYTTPDSFQNAPTQCNTCHQ